MIAKDQQGKMYIAKTTTHWSATPVTLTLKNETLEYEAHVGTVMQHGDSTNTVDFLHSIVFDFSNPDNLPPVPCTLIRYDPEKDLEYHFPIKAIEDRGVHIEIEDINNVPTRYHASVLEGDIQVKRLSFPTPEELELHQNESLDLSEELGL